MTSNKEDKNGNNKIWNAILKFQRNIMIVCSLLIVMGISLVAILRYIFKTDLYGMEEIIVIFAFWLYFMGGSYGSYDKSHITADLVSVYVSNRKIRNTFKVISSFITTALCVLITYYAIDFFIWGIVKGAKTPVWQIPLVVPQSSILLGFILMSFYFIVYLIEDVKKLFVKDGLEASNK